MRLVGLVKVTIYFAVLGGITIVSAEASGYKETCIGDDLVLTHVTPTIQTIATLAGPYGGKNSLVRRKIENVAIEEEFVSGYLNTKYFVDDDLVGLAGPDDVEGFFIINRSDHKVTSGMERRALLDLVESTYGLKFLDFMGLDRIEEHIGCRGGG